MRVLMLSARADVGGGPKHIFDLIKASDSRISYYVGCPVELPYWAKYSELVNGRVIEIPHRKFSFYHLLRLLCFCIKNNIALVHSHGKGASLYGKALNLLLRLPHLYTLHGFHTGSYGGLKRRLYLIYEKFTSRLVSKVICVSRSEFNRVLASHVFKRDKLLVVVNGVDICNDNFIRNGRVLVRRNLGFSESDFVVASISRFDFQKNVAEIIDIIKLFHAEKEVKFVVGGGGPDFEAVSNYSKSLSLDNIIFTGYLDNSLEYLSAADVLLSSSRWEGLPLILIEAMAVGRPIVASDVPGNSDVVDDSVTGYLYSLGNLKMAYDCISQLKNNETLRKEMGFAAKAAHKEFFSTSRMAVETHKVYQSLMLAGEYE